MKLPLPRFDGRTVLVIGDVMLDRYWHGESLRISQEAPVPVVTVHDREDRPGGAANVALNVVALGAACVLIGAIGDDEAGVALVQKLQAAGVQLDLLTVPGWPTSTKLRVISRRQQMLRLDLESPLPSEHLPAIVAKVQRWAAHVDAVVLEDYDKGVLAEPEQVMQACAGLTAPVVVDPKHKPLQRYRGAAVLKPNLAEFTLLTGAQSTEADFERRARALLTASGIGALLVTRGDHGMTLIEASASGAQHIPARKVEVFDVTGAGDTVAATLAAALAAGFTLVQAAALANVAAGIAVTHSGTVAVTAAELRLAIRDDAEGNRGVMTADQLALAVEDARKRGERVVFTNGCFDILHAGHVGYLEEARRLGDRLVVAINSDASTRRLKGPGRPINPLEQRMAVLRGLGAVDWVVGFDEDTPLSLLQQLKPDVLVKGGDYALDQVVGGDLVTQWGGEVHVLSLLDDCSTTNIVSRIKDDQR